MRIRTPVTIQGGCIKEAGGQTLVVLSPFWPKENYEEIVRSINLLPQLIAKLEEASQFIHECALDEGYDEDNPIVAQIDALVAKAKS